MASARSQSHALVSYIRICSLMVAWLLCLAPAPTAANDIQWIKYTGNDGVVWLDDQRKPSLYTKNFGDCQGDSLINVTRFDAAYYKDNMTVLFHLEGSSALTDESLMLYIGVFAYGELRFNLTFNPCNANIRSLCPLNSSIPISANGIIPVAQSDVANIPPIALTIPDFEGQAILRIFANSTESQIACFSAVITNGSTFEHPAAVASILGLFTVVALISSIVATIYGQNILETRKHYAHSLSMLVVFSVYQHIFFTGALSMNWPSVLVSFWSNYAWSAGMIYSKKMQNSINQFIDDNHGNITMVGAAQSGVNADGLGGGYQISQIYKRTPAALLETYSMSSLDHAFNKRQSANLSGPSWYGSPVHPGLPLPGNYSGFAGTLGQTDIPASNAFLTGLLWFLIFLACLIAIMVLLKWCIEGLSALRWIKTERLAIFRKHWLWFTGAAVLRAWYIAFFMMMFLTMFQFTLGGTTGMKALAAVTFLMFLIGLLGISAYALWYRTRSEKLPAMPTSEGTTESSAIGHHSTWYRMDRKRAAQSSPTEKSRSWIQRSLHDFDSGLLHVHDDENYTTKFGWLASRFRRSRWWFFSVWLVYELVRAAFYGGAAGRPMIQVFGLLAWEILALVAIVLLKPFESNRLNLLMVYLLGFSKVSTVALSAAFDPRFRLGRILTTVIGVVIIVIQGLLTISLMIAIVIGAASSYMSVSRYHETMKPASWLDHRRRYFAHVDQKATDRPKPPPPPPTPAPEGPKEPYFMVSAVRRQPKIEDEEDLDELDSSVSATQSSNFQSDGVATTLPRSESTRSHLGRSNLPHGARLHRSSWSARDFHHLDLPARANTIQSHSSADSLRDNASGRRSASVRASPKSEVDGEWPGVSSSGGPHRRPRRSNSTPYRPKGHESIMDEEKENDADAITS